jgi:transposase-like protein
VKISSVVSSHTQWLSIDLCGTRSIIFVYVPGPEMKKDYKVPDAMDNLHGVLMHGDGTQGKDHGHEDARRVEDEKRDKGSIQVGNLMDDIHGILMHGDSERGKDHEHEDNKLREGKVADEPMGVDPDQALHGGEHKHNEKVKKILDEFDSNRLWDEKKKKQEKHLAFSFGKFISSDIMDNVDKLKKRYLSRFFGGGEEKKDDLDAKTDDDSAKMDEDRKVSPRMKVGVIGPKKEDMPLGSGNSPKHDET